jgi:serine/threonine-protein kinase
MLLNGTHKVKVTDFGIARITTASRTKTGAVLGTPSYMSPEQISGKKVDGRSDIFSLGIVLYEMLNGSKPFVSNDITSLMYQIAHKRHPSLRKRNTRIPQVVEKILDKALAKDAGQRYQRAGLMAAHLWKVVERIDQVNTNSQRGQ